MKGICGKLAGLALFMGIAMAQNHEAEYDRICSNPPTGEVEIENGFYATYHCDKWPKRDGYRGTLSADKPESCVKACVEKAGCEASFWASVNPKGCYAFGVGTLEPKAGYVYITYRQDCQKQNQPAIDALNRDITDLKDQLKKCNDDKNKCNSDLKTCNNNNIKCNNDLKKCRNSGTPPGGGRPGGGIPGSCNDLKNGQVINIGGTKYVATKGIKHASRSWLDFNHIVRNYGYTLQQCMQSCANNGNCALFDYNNSQRFCDHYKSAGRTLNDGNYCYFRKQ